MISKPYSILLRALLLPSLLLCSAALSAQQQNNSVPAAAEATPEQVVTSLENSLLDVMQTEQLDHSGRSLRLQPVVERAFNFPRMGRFLFGSRWKSFDQAQQQQFAEAFSGLTTATYAARFNQYNNERFVEVSVAQPGSNRAQVRHQLITGKGQQIAFDYLLLQEDQQWRIVNITTRGVSDLALKRTQYSKLFNEGGLDAVIDYLQQQTERLAAE